MAVHLLDIEWLLSTLFDASLLLTWAAGNGGSFFVPFWGKKVVVSADNHVMMFSWLFTLPGRHHARMLCATVGRA